VLNGTTVDVIHFPGDSVPLGWKNSTVALGNFDGLHRGHLKILEKVRDRADEYGGTAIILTFDPHPPRIVRPDRAPRLLMTQSQKLQGLGEAGMDGVAIVKFSLALSQWEPETFVRNVLVDWLDVKNVCVGANFLFGRDRGGNFSLLRSLGARYGFRAEKVEPVRYKEFVVSSTRLRRLVSEGLVDEAGVLFGHHYSIEGRVIKGRGRGQKHGFPTANLDVENELLPTDGVYVTTVTVDGIIKPAITNIGVRPTFESAGDRTVETHLLSEAVGDLYGQRIAVSFVQRLRGERAFSDVQSFTHQITKDCEQARELFERISL
jgi:riboflavin kinase/FMN adenylyltransferase